MRVVQNTEVVYYVAKVIKKSPDFSMRSVYNIHNNTHDKTEDGALALLPGPPLMITQNIDRPWSKHLQCLHHQLSQILTIF